MHGQCDLYKCWLCTLYAAGIGTEFEQFFKNDRLDLDLLQKAVKQMAVVEIAEGVLPKTQSDADTLARDAELPEGEDDVAAAEYFQQHREPNHHQQQQQQPAPHQAQELLASVLNPAAPWATDGEDDAADVQFLQSAPAAAAHNDSGPNPPAQDAAALPSLSSIGHGASTLAQSSAAAAGEAAATRATGSFVADVLCNGMLPSGVSEASCTLQGGKRGAAAAAIQVGHSQATLDVAAAAGAGRAIIAKRSHASRRGATYAELVQPVHGMREWQVYRQLLRQCVSRKGTNWQQLGDLWDLQMESDPQLPQRV